jgi:L-idonate 5-dehydrogenase
MKAIFLHGKRDLRFDEIPQDNPASDVKIKVHSVGICGSDVHYFSHGRCGPFVPKAPLTLGHEFSGVTVDSADGLPEGARVTVDPLHSCGVCELCVGNRRNLCPQKRYMGSAAVYPHLHGALREFVSVPRQNVYRLPDNVSFEEGAMVEPAAVSLHAVKRAGDIRGAKVLVSGGGTIGQLITRMARLEGADVHLSDPRAYARSVAKESGASTVIDPTAESLAENAYDCVFEASGALPAFVAALNGLKKGGTLVQIGTLPDELTMPGNIIMAKELNVLGAIQYSGEFKEIIEMLRDGRLHIADLNTHRFPFEQTVDAIDFAISGSESLKVQVQL